MTIREVHKAEFDYPGAFMPETISFDIETPDLEGARKGLVKNQGEGSWPLWQWYALTIKTAVEKRYVDPENPDDETWVRQGLFERKAYYIVGEVFTSEQLEAGIPKLDQTLITNARCNGNKRGLIRTRRGNWQPWEDDTILLTPADVKWATDKDMEGFQ